MKLHIRNMVCNRCKLAVKAELENSGFHPMLVELGEVQIKEELNPEQKKKLNIKLLNLGFEIIDDKKSLIIEQIKILILELVHAKNAELKTNLSDYLSKALNHDYSLISSLFSEVEGTTIEKYFISQKIEKVKELLTYDELSLSEISYRLNYSSVSHLSKQFKLITGLTPSYFKNLKEKKRKALDEV